MKRALYGVLVLALMACTNTSGETTTAQSEPATDTAATASTATDTAATTPAAETKEENPSMSSYENKVAELHTSAGEIDIRFFPDVAPGHVKNFLDLSAKGFYNGTKFHRIVPGFMIQGGDPNTIKGDPSTWGFGGSAQNVKAEFNSVSHKRGIVSMARSQDPNSASSQFFICVANATFLDGNYTVFGEVTKGMDVADKIVNGPRSGERATSPVSIEKIVIRDARDDEKGPAPK